jgi:hypothetical protein
MLPAYAQELRIVRLLGKQSYLLASLMTLLVLLPLLQSDNTSRFWLSSILTLIVISGPLSLATNKWGFFLSVITGTVMVINSWLGEPANSPEIQLLMELNTVAFFLIMGAMVFGQHVFQSDEVDMETLLGAVNAYICLGIMYAFAYAFVLKGNPAAFSGDLIESGSFESSVYLSFVTMTTLGYGDITPKTNLAAILTWTQALIGQLYIALSVARIVGLMVAKESTPVETTSAETTTAP